MAKKVLALIFQSNPYSFFVVVKRKDSVWSNERNREMRTSSLKTPDYVFGSLVVIGALGWGIAGLFKIDLAAGVFGSMMFVARLLCYVVGLALVYNEANVGLIWRRLSIRFHVPAQSSSVSLSLKHI